MPKSENQKLKLLRIIEILRDTDEDNPTSVGGIIDKLASCGITAERKSIYSDLEALSVFGLDVIREKGKIYLGEREFQIPELKLLIDACQSSSFITERKTRVLTEKLASFAGKGDKAALMSRSLSSGGKIKNANETIYNVVDRLHNALYRDRSVEFKYYGYKFVEGEAVKALRHDGAVYHASPWELAFDDGFYYLIAFDEKDKRIKHFRVDKMTEVHICRKPRTGKDEYASRGNSFHMFGGEKENVTLSVDNSLLDVIIDRYGMLPLRIIDENRFGVTVSAEVSDLFLGWLLSFGNKMRVTAPESVVERVRVLVTEIETIYE